MIIFCPSPPPFTLILSVHLMISIGLPLMIRYKDAVQRRY